MRRCLFPLLASLCLACGPAPTPDAGAIDAPPVDGPSLLDAPMVDAGAACDATTETRIEHAELRVLHHDGQTFVAWHDRGEGEAGAAFRYRVYRSVTPITTDADLAGAELLATGLLNHSGQLFGSAFLPSQRLDGTAPMAILEDGGAPLPTWWGLHASSVVANGCAYFAVLATDEADVPMESIEPGRNATTAPIAELVAPHEPIFVYDSDDRGIYSPNTRITGTPDLPLEIVLHASNAGGGGAGDYGDYYLYFADEAMGYRDGLPGVFSVEETHSGTQVLRMRNRDTLVAPDGSSGIETHWFGYVTELGGHERHAHPFTEARLSYLIPWVVTRYHADPDRVYVVGGSMGAWGTMTFAARRPDLFSAVYPDRPRFRQGSMAGVGTAPTDADTLPDGTAWRDHHDSVRFVSEHRADLPFIGWNVGRNDGFATWQEQLDMVAALTASHHGFAFAWNDGDHSSGSDASAEVMRWYPPERFARDLSYPAFGHSSIDDDLGPGDPLLGDLSGGINLGFSWTDPIDEAGRWSSDIGNALATAEMTVDVTPRRAQRFHPAAGASVAFTTSSGQSGTVTVDAEGLVTIPGVRLAAGAPTTLTITAP